MIIETLGWSALYGFAFMTVIFLISQYMRDYSIIDIFWGMSFLSIATFVLIFIVPQTYIAYLAYVAILFWSVRYSLHIIAKKQWGKEDFRYTEFRKNWSPPIWLNAYVRVFLLQAVLMVLIFSSFIWIVHAVTEPWWAYAGLMVWVVGFVIETMADWQLDQHKKKGKIVTVGLWKYSRHPNYFGEALQWWGFWIPSLLHPLGWIAVVSPLTITLILWLVSIPILEKKWKNDKAYQRYAKKTSSFIPWF